MDWLESINKTLDYIEKNIMSEIDIDEISKITYVSPYYLQKGFSVMTGYSIGEYIRNRRLYLAALELVSSKAKIIDIAYKYLYETPESFTKAFIRFHDNTPYEIRKDSSKIKTFLPLRLTIEIRGGNNMDYSIEKMDSFKVIGVKKEFNLMTSYKEIPKYWDEFMDKYCSNIYNKKEEEYNEYESTIVKNNIGELAICIDDLNNGNFNYVIGGFYNGTSVPDGFEVIEISANEWAKFNCVGPLPGSLQAVNTKIFKEWLPGNPNYEMAGKYNIEWYSKDNNCDERNYKSAIWIPIKRK